VEAMEIVARRGIPQWLELDKDNFRGMVKTLPSREELVMPVQEQLVVELYSK
jgi:small subunit ribosomal protein S4